MKKIKRILIFIPVFIMIFANLAVPAFAATYDGTFMYFDSPAPTADEIRAYARESCLFYNYGERSYLANDMHYFVTWEQATDTRWVYNVVLLDNSIDTIYWNGASSAYVLNPSGTGGDYVNYCNFTLIIDFGQWNADQYSAFLSDGPQSIPFFASERQDFWFNNIYFYMSDLTILDFEGNIIQQPPDTDLNYNANITYDSDNQEISFVLENLETDLDLGMSCGVYNYQTFGLAVCGAGLDVRRLMSIEPLINYATDKNEDYTTYTAFLSVYNGTEVIDIITVNLGDLVSGTDDDMFNNKKDYLPFPDPDDYFSDAPEFPSLTPFPDFPGFDPDHPWQSLFDILQWLGQCILVPFQNLFLIIRWFAQTVVYYIVNGWHYLQDCFYVIVKNIGIALYNLAVDIKKLLIRLFVPKNLEFEQKLKQKFPIFWSIKHLVNNLSVTGNESITVSLPSFNHNIASHTMTVSAVSSLGQSGCNTLFILSRVVIAVFCLFSMINIISSVFNMSLHSTVKED